MIRTRSLLWLAAILLVLAPVSNVTFAGEDVPKIASEEEAKQALAVFKDEYKAKGLKGDDKLMQRDYAIKNLVKTVHPLIAKELGKIAKKKDADLSTLAVIYMGELRAVAGAAGPEVVAAMKRHKKDTIFQMSALDTLGYMRYLGANDEIASLMKHKDFAVKKYAIRSAGWTGDIRLMPALLKLLGIEVKQEKSAKKGEGKEKKGESESKEDGYSWEGVDVEYDTGTSGDHDQQMAEKIGKEKMAQNKANATAGQGGGGSGGTTLGGSAGASGGRGASGRTLEELVPTILRALKAMTGEEFGGPKDIKLWLQVNQKQIRLLEQRFERREKAQKKGEQGS